MINSKNALIKALKENKDKIKFMTIENHAREGYQVGVIRNAGTIVQTNAFTIETKKDNGEIVNSWVYLNGKLGIDVKDNIITYKTGDIKIKILEVK